MKSFAEIRRKNELLAGDLAILRQNQLLQQGNEADDLPWSDTVMDKEFQIKTVSLALDRASLKRVNRSLDDVFTSMCVVFIILALFPKLDLMLIMFFNFRHILQGSSDSPSENGGQTCRQTFCVQTLHQLTF